MSHNAACSERTSLFIYVDNTNKRVGRTNIPSFGAIGLYDIIFDIMFFL